MSPLLQRTAEKIEPPLRHATQRFGLRAADVLPLIVIAISALVVYLGLQVGDEVYEAVSRLGLPHTLISRLSIGWFSIDRPA